MCSKSPNLASMRWSVTYPPMMNTTGQENGREQRIWEENITEENRTCISEIRKQKRARRGSRRGQQKSKHETHIRTNTLNMWMLYKQIEPPSFELEEEGEEASSCSSTLKVSIRIVATTPPCKQIRESKNIYDPAFLTLHHGHVLAWSSLSWELSQT